MLQTMCCSFRNFFIIFIDDLIDDFIDFGGPKEVKVKEVRGSRKK
jgi:hypothetical protein